MTASQAIEYRITRRILQRRDDVPQQRSIRIWVDRLIAILAATAGIFLLGSYLEELLWVVLAMATVFVLGAEEY